MRYNCQIFSEMPLSKDKASIATAVSVDLKNRLKRIAKFKEWTLSHTVKLFMEKFIDAWEKELGIDTNQAPTPKKSKKSVS